MSFRPLLPSTTSGLAVDPGVHHEPGHDLPDGHGAGSTRKRRTEVLTVNACTNCKKGKAKCNGDKPCRTCLNRHKADTCEYRPNIRMEKEELARQNQLRDDILKAVLASDRIRAEVRYRITRGDDLETIFESIQDSTRPTQVEETSSATEINPPSKLMDYEMEKIAKRARATVLNRHQWTSVTSNADLINHLIELYFTWVHPIHMLFSESLFRANFKDQTTNEYCTGALVNVICAMACNLLQASTGEETGETVLDMHTLQENFAVEGRALIQSQTEILLTRIQAIAVLALVEFSAGQSSRATSLVKLASIELFRARAGNQTQDDVREISSWGILSLKIASADFTCEEDDLLRLPSPKVLEHVRTSSKEVPWRFYRQEKDFRIAGRPRLAILTTSELAKLLETTQVTNAFYYTKRAAQVTANDVLLQHLKYLAWKQALPDAISSAEETPPSLPHVFFLHIFFHTTIVLLFHPLVGLEMASEGEMKPSPKATCLHSARIGIQLLERYHRLYTCRFQPRLQVLCLVHLCDCLVRLGTSSQAEDAAWFCMKSLTESRAGHAVCGPLQELFRNTVIQNGIHLPESSDHPVPMATSFTLDQILDACTRLTYAQPIEQIQRRLSPTLTEDWNQESVILNGNLDRERPMGISSILNR
ncbi:MAG: hypothetical protein M1837_001667 [Sclerophora amabilis]|nr:MAG: hypothetical protein M1837_001667 [Sclerophora amabilis]